jgi:hypothetical protein
MTDILILLAVFGIKHFVADFVLQFPYMIGQKGIYGARGGIDHASIHGILTFWIVLAFLGTGNALMAVTMSALDAVIHYHVDWAKQQLSQGTTPADRKFWILLGGDQALHYLTYILIIGLMV